MDERAIAEEKERLRREARSLRRTWSEDFRSESSAAIASRLRTLPVLHDALALGVFDPLPGEPDLRSLYAEWRAEGRHLLYPRRDGETLVWVPVNDEKADLRSESGKRLREPVGAPSIHPPEVVLVPGLLFDDRGFRLGTGGGWYDRAFSTLPAAHRVGVCFEPQRVKSIPRLPHDLPMHRVLSPERELIPPAPR